MSITENTYSVKGMHCASCSSLIEKTLKKIDGVQSVQANFGTETAKVAFDKSKTTIQALSKKIEPLGYSFILPDHSGHNMTAQEMGMSQEEHAAHTGIGQSKEQKLIEVKELQSKVFLVMPMAIVSIFIMIWDGLAQIHFLSMPYVWQELFHHLLPIFATITLFVVGKPYLLGLWRFLRYGKANMDSLIGIGTLAAFLYSFVLQAFEDSLSSYLNVHHTYYDVAIVVIAFITLGKYLEAKAKIKTGDAIEKLLTLQAKTALVIRHGKEQEVAITEVVHGDHIIVKPGARIPVDGIITEGSSFIDESMISGEPMPVEKNVGAKVVAGTMNTTKSFTFKATKVGFETLLAHIIKMVQEAQGSRAPIQGLADKISAVFVPIVIALSFIALTTWLIVGIPHLGLAKALSYGLSCFVAILVIACPCALGLATPTAIIVGVGKGAKEGILIKDAATLEKLQGVNALVMDKTGTITRGKPELVEIVRFSEDVNDRQLIALLAALEEKSEHPLAHAVLSYAKEKKIAPKLISHFEIIKGKGIRGTIDKKEYVAGNVKLLSDLKIPFKADQLQAKTVEGKTPIILAQSKKVLGVVFVADAIKPQAIESIRNLRESDIKIIMLTGDDRNTATAIGKEAGVDEVIAEVLPDEKLKAIKDLQSQGYTVAMAGDGINDAPALAQADVGIAMATGTDVAIETAGITLLNGDISKLVKAVKLSKLTMRGIKQNLFWAFIYNIIGIPLAGGVFYPLFGWLLNPVFAGLAMAFSSVSVVSNSLRIKTKNI